jgi:hypothetical protein
MPICMANSLFWSVVGAALPLSTPSLKRYIFSTTKRETLFLAWQYGVDDLRLVSREGPQEGRDIAHLLLAKLFAELHIRHGAHRLFESLSGAVVEVGGRKGDIAPRENYDTRRSPLSSQVDSPLLFYVKNGM